MKRNNILRDIVASTPDPVKRKVEILVKGATILADEVLMGISGATMGEIDACVEDIRNAYSLGFYLNDNENFSKHDL